jgi:hypothetical protein
LIKHKYIEALILEFHVRIDASLLAMGAMLSMNVTRKSDQPIMYVYRLLNIIK